MPNALNDQRIRSATEGTLWDGVLKGFGLRVGKHTKTFIVLVDSGRRKRIGHYPSISLAQARAEARKILAEKTLGKIHPKETAFADARDDFLEDCETRLRPRTLALYTRHLHQLPFGRKSLTDVRAADVLNALSGRKRSEKEHLFRVARTFFTWCVRRHLIDRSPMERLAPPPNFRPRERVLAEDELRAVYGYACRLGDPMQRLVCLLIHTGQRLGEVRHLKWEYIGPDSITLPGKLTKNGRTHMFPIGARTRALLDCYPRLSEYVFPAARSHVRGRPVHLMAVSTAARQSFVESCGVTGWTLHDLRRTYATNMQKLGVRLEVTEALLNHVSGTRSGIIGIYQRYDFLPEMRAAVGRWEEKLHSLVIN